MPQKMGHWDLLFKITNLNKRESDNRTNPPFFIYFTACLPPCNALQY